MILYDKEETYHDVIDEEEVNYEVVQQPGK